MGINVRMLSDELGKILSKQIVVINKLGAVSIFGTDAVFLLRPISLGFLIVAVLLLVIPIVTQRKKLFTLLEE